MRSSAEGEAAGSDGGQAVDSRAIEADLGRLIAEEMHLLGRELEDSLSASESQRLEHLTETLDRATELLVEHRATGPHR